MQTTVSSLAIHDQTGPHCAETLTPPVQTQSIVIERVCRLLIRFAELTEEIEREEAESISTQEY